MSIRETHENITLFHCSGCYHIYLKPMENIILKKNIGGHYLKSPKENIIYKVIYESVWIQIKAAFYFPRFPLFFFFFLCV